MTRDDAARRALAIIAALVCLADNARAGSCSAAKLCCQGRDSGCVIQKESPNAIIESPRDKPCYCDHACLKLADCCDDFRATCGVVDCTVNEWGAWSACDNGCGSGTQRRSRAIEIPERNGGKHCPRLDQVRSCRSYEACLSGYHPQPRDRGVTVLSFFKAHENESRAGSAGKPGDRSSSCVAFTIVRASRACARLSASLAEGSRVCVELEDDASDRLVGIGRWKVTRDGVATPDVGASLGAANSTCHGKWIGDSRLAIDCADPRCTGGPLAARFADPLRRARRSVLEGAPGYDGTTARTGRRRRRGRRRKRRTRRRTRGQNDDQRS